MSAFKFRIADMVQVAAEFPPWMPHFPAGERAIVVERNESQPGYRTYALELEHSGWCAWYEEGLLALLEHDKSALIDEWTAKREAEGE